MGIFPFFKKKPFFPDEEQAKVVEAIRIAEKETSGEIRVFIENNNPLVNPLERAAEIFFELKMENTAHRNGVLLYIAMKDHELALFADEGIYNKAGGAQYWNDAVAEMLTEFKDHHIIDGMVHCILKIGQTLKDNFPYEASTDKNELPDDIVFGK